jgi:hypothetical protein
MQRSSAASVTTAHHPDLRVTTRSAVAGVLTAALALLAVAPASAHAAGAPVVRRGPVAEKPSR